MTDNITAIELKTANNWKECADSISLFTPVTLRVGDDLITIELRHGSKVKLSYCIFTNGKIKGNETKENQEKYWIKKERYLYSPAKIKELEKKCGKKFIKEKIPEDKRKYSFYVPFSSSFSTIKSQYVKRHTAIFWVKGY